MNLHRGILFILGLALGFGLSFLGFGLMWIGLKPSLQFLNCASFFAVAFLIGRITRDGIRAGLAVGIGALPIAALFSQFRDKNDSHLFPILLVSGWLVGIAFGSWLGSRKPAPRP